MNHRSLLLVVFASVGLLSACGDEAYVTEPELAEPTEVPLSPGFLTDGSESLLAKRGGSRSDKVTLCHFPPGNPGNPQIIRVGAPAAEHHLRNHDLDGIVGVRYDENCVPLCPCWVEEDLSPLTWDVRVGVPGDNTQGIQDFEGPGPILNAAAFITFDRGPAPAPVCHGAGATPPASPPFQLVSETEARICLRMLDQLFDEDNP